MKEDTVSQFRNSLKKYDCQIILTALITVICMLGIFDRDLWTPDEPRVAAISLEMSRNGNLVIPHLAGEPFIEKPPLYFAVAAGLIKIIGPVIGNTGAVRFASAFFALGTLLATFFLAKVFRKGSFALLSMVILGTMVGFVDNFHWARVDTALSFFVVSSVWCFAEGYLKNRSWFLPLAGFFCACAFLSKGLIGPVLTSIPWAGLVMLWLKQTKNTGKKKEFFILQHLICIFVFTLLAGIWVELMILKGGRELWHEWFWVNHVGRLDGSAEIKGHIYPGRPFYYLNTVAMYGMPWLPLIIIWSASRFNELWQHKTLSRENFFLLVWAVGTILFLSLSVTKRSIYITPALPAFAIMCAVVLERGPSRVFEVYSMFWFICCTAVLAFLVGLPFTAYLWGKLVPARMVGFMSTFGFNNLIAGVGLIMCLYFIFRRQRNNNIPLRFLVATSLLYISLFAGPMQAIDLEKSMQLRVQEFVEKIPMEKRSRVAGWNFGETMLADFYYYCNWSVPQVRQDDRLQEIIKGQDDEFDSIIISGVASVTGLVRSPCYIIAEGDLDGFGNRERIFWVEGSNREYGKSGEREK